MFIPRPLYNVLLYTAKPLAWMYLSKRAKKQPEYNDHWDERFGKGKYPKPQEGRTRIWIHAVSVGEMRATIPLIEGILHRWYNVDIMLTCMTPTGRAVAETIIGRFAHRVVVCYLPYDTEGYMTRFMKQTKPALCLLMETEVWPNLTYVAQKLNIPVLLVNARLSEKSLQKSMKVKSLIMPAMGRLKMTLAQSQDDAERLIKLGCKDVQVVGNLKFDYVPNSAQLRIAAEFKKMAQRPILILASSRDGEEYSFLKTVEEQKKNWGDKKPLVIIIPRHPQRFKEVLKLIQGTGKSVLSRSQIRNWREALSQNGPEYILGDSMGEMALYYALGDVALMGGSYAPFGSQSMIEPCSIGIPTVVGPSTFNFSDAVEEAEKAGAILRAQDFEEGVRKAYDLMNNQEEWNKVHQNALLFAESQRGATERIIKMVDKVLSEG